MLFISRVKDFSRTSNLGAVNLVLSCFLRNRRTCLSFLNTSVKSWYHKSFGKILMNMFSESSLSFPGEIRKPHSQHMLWNYICSLVLANFGSTPTSTLSFIPFFCALNAAVTWWVTKEAKGMDEDGERGFFEAQVYISSLNSISSLSPLVTDTKASFPSPQTHSFEIFLTLYKAGLDLNFNLISPKAARDKWKHNFFFLNLQPRTPLAWF